MPESGARRRRWPWFVGGAAVVLVALGVGVWWFWLRDDAPPPVSLDAAVERVDPSGTDPDADRDDDTDGDGDGAAAVAGTWVVDPSVAGEGDDGVFAGFRIDEELGSGIGSTTAVGRTPEVSGSVTIDGTSVSDVEVEADLTAIRSDRSPRDGAIQRALDTETFPVATFRLTEPIELGEVAASGDARALTATGDLTVSGVTRTVEVDLDAQLRGDVLVVVGRTGIVLSDFDVEAPSAPIVVSVADDAVVEWQLFLTRS